MVKRILAIAVLVAIAASLFVGCGSTSTSPSTTTSVTTPVQASSTQPEVKKISGNIDFFTYRDDFANTYYTDFIKEFNQKYPDVTVTVSTSKNSFADLKVKMAASDLPDVFTFGGIGTGELFSDEQAIQNLLPVDEFPFASQWDGNGAFKGSDGKYYGLTFGSTVMALIYNKKMFNELGLTAPTTLDELIAAGQKIKATGKIGIAFTSKPIWTYVFYNFLAAAMTGDYSAYQKSLLAKDEPFNADDPNVKMMGIIKKIADSKIIEDDTASYDWEPMKKDWAAGKIGMALGQNVLISQITNAGLTEADFAMVPFPYDNSKGPYKVPFLPDLGLSLSNNSKNLDAAKAFFAFHMDDKYLEYAKKTGVLSARKDKQVEYPYMTDFMSLPMEKVFKPADVTEYSDFTKKIMLDLTSVYSAVGVGSKTPEQQTKLLNDMWKKGKTN